MTVGLVSIQFGTLLDLPGLNKLLTGRIDLWAAVWEMIQPRFWFGYGFRAFWIAEDEIPRAVFNMVGWMPRSAHNGYLDLWLSLGVAGIFMFMLSVFTSAAGLLGRAASDGWDQILWPIIFQCLFLLANMTEDVILAHNDMFWVLYVATIAWQSRSMRAGTRGRPLR